MDEYKDSFEEQEPVRVRTKEETDKKCPMCDGVMEFDPATGGLKCPYCGHEIAIESGAAAAETDFDRAEDLASHDWGVAKKRVICESCGAETIYDALETANECPYCGSNQVMETHDDDTMAPGGVCPFKIDKQTAGENFKKWLSSKWFCPSLAKEKARPGAFHGVYLPYWTFDTQTYSQYTGRYGIDRRAREYVNGREQIRVVTDWYWTSGDYQEFINDQLVIGTTRHDASILREIEPFDTEGNVAYKPQYLAGFAAERYSVGLKEGWEHGRSDIARHLEAQISSKIRWEHHADHVSGVDVRTAYDDLRFKYLLLPVWLSSFKYNDKVYNFMVNGQTGRVGGKSPVSPWRVAAAVAIATGIIGSAWYFLTAQPQPSPAVEYQYPVRRQQSQIPVGSYGHIYVIPAQPAQRY